MELIELHVSNSLLFHLDGYDTPTQSWDKFRALQLEVEFSSMVLHEHASIEDYLAKFSSLLAQLKGFGKTKSNDECIFLILSKLKGSYQVFSSTFYPTMDALGAYFKMPTFELFYEYFVNA